MDVGVHFTANLTNYFGTKWWKKNCFWSYK